jgi:hypothetical protein
VAAAAELLHRLSAALSADPAARRRTGRRAGGACGGGGGGCDAPDLARGLAALLLVARLPPPARRALARVAGVLARSPLPGLGPEGVLALEAQLQLVVGAGACVFTAAGARVGCCVAACLPGSQWSMSRWGGPVVGGFVGLALLSSLFFGV